MPPSISPAAKTLIMLFYLGVAVYAISATWGWIAGAAWFISFIFIVQAVSGVKAAPEP